MQDPAPSAEPDTTGPDTSGPDPTFRLAYRSRSRIAPEDRRAELGTLFSTARAHNKRQGISGALLVHGDWFVQTLEGDERAVRRLFARIETDPRHEAVELLDAQTVGGRVFARWSMAKVAEDGESDIALIAHADGIAPAAPRDSLTADQAQVLAAMRAATRVSPAPA
ncbi:MAG TPA: BLUF domain-containing protein [Mycobacteriales bacterium]|jgi:hypothetical protein|nr:BLUF domain-containing protein [Mycobacteriales bacterium]